MNLLVQFECNENFSLPLKHPTSKTCKSINKSFLADAHNPSRSDESFHSNITGVFNNTVVICNVHVMLLLPKCSYINWNINGYFKSASIHFEIINIVFPCFRNIPVNNAKTNYRWKEDKITFSSTSVETNQTRDTSKDLWRKTRDS